MACSIDTKNKANTRFTNLYKSIGLSIDQSRDAANNTVNDVLGSVSQASPIDITGVQPETINRESLDRIFNHYLSLYNIDSTEHSNHLKSILSDAMDILDSKEAHQLYTTINQGITRGEIEANNIAINIEQDISNTPIPMSPNEVLAHEIVHAITKTVLSLPENYGLFKEIEKLWKQTRQELNEKYNGKGYEVFLNKNSAIPMDRQIEVAKARYDYIFGTSSVGRQKITDQFGNVTYKTVNVNLHE